MKLENIGLTSGQLRTIKSKNRRTNPYQFPVFAGEQ